MRKINTLLESKRIEFYEDMLCLPLSFSLCVSVMPSEENGMNTHRIVAKFERIHNGQHS